MKKRQNTAVCLDLILETRWKRRVDRYRVRSERFGSGDTDFPRAGDPLGPLLSPLSSAIEFPLTDGKTAVVAPIAGGNAWRTAALPVGGDGCLLAETRAVSGGLLGPAASRSGLTGIFVLSRCMPLTTIQSVG
jgi:hypothetical protein